MPDHDALYHRLFSHARMVAELLRGFFDPDWVVTLDLERMERINAKHLAAKGQRRDGDIVWRVPLKAGGDTYRLLMLEFQSVSDPWMALRVLVYAGLLWQQAVRDKRLPPDGRLPPVFPIVLYNGDPRWRAPLSLDSLVALPPDSPLWRYQPRVEYHLLDEGAFPPEALGSRDTLAEMLFRLENAGSPEQIRDAVDDVIDWFSRHPGFEALKTVFGALASRALTKTEDLPTGARVTEDLLEIRTMLANRPAEWKRQWKAEGHLEGRRDGAGALLTRQLERRFGPLPETTRQRIASADVSDLETWGDRVLDAMSIDDVLH